MPFFQHILASGQSAVSSSAILGAVDRGLTAAGSSQSNAWSIRMPINVFTTVPTGTGTVLPGAAAVGDNVFIFNGGVNNLSVYPPSTITGESGTIDGGVPLAPVTVPAGKSGEFYCTGKLTWVSLIPGAAAGGGVTEVDGNYPITTANPTGPIVDVSFGPVNMDQIMYGDHATGNFAQSADLVWRQDLSELIVNGTIYIPDDSNPGFFATTGQAAALETAVGAQATMSANGIGGILAQTAFIQADSTAASPHSAAWLQSGQVRGMYWQVTVGEKNLTPPSGTDHSSIDMVWLLNTTTTADGMLFRFSGYDATLHIIPTGSGAANASLAFDLNPRWSYDYSTPTTGFTYTLPSNLVRYVIFNPAGTLATGTFKFTTNPFDGQVVTISTTQQITALTINGNGNTVSNAVSTLAAGASVSYLFRSTNTTWYRVHLG